jgi:hypothetical protein
MSHMSVRFTPSRQSWHEDYLRTFTQIQLTT